MANNTEPLTTERRPDGPRAPVQPVAEPLSNPAISAPMLAVHAPIGGIHTWNDFFIHSATFVIGLLIAVGLEQTVEHFHHRHEVSEIRESLNFERCFNINRFAVLRDEFHRFVPKFEISLAVFQCLRSHPMRRLRIGRESWIGWR